MAVAVTEVRKVPNLRSVRSYGTVVFSGAYVADGEAVAIPKPFTTKAPYTVHIQGIKGNRYLYDPVTTKVKILVAVGTELPVAAYPVSVTEDTITYDAEFPKLG